MEIKIFMFGNNFITNNIASQNLATIVQDKVIVYLKTYPCIVSAFIGSCEFGSKKYIDTLVVVSSGLPFSSVAF